MDVGELGRDGFGRFVGAPGVALVDCRASWCGGCGAFEPVFERVAASHPEHRFAKLDTEEERGLAAALEVTHVPTLLVYRDGLLLLRHPGSLDEERLESIVAQAQALDMDLVRGEIEREHREGPEAG